MNLLNPIDPITIELTQENNGDTKWSDFTFAAKPPNVTVYFRFKITVQSETPPAILGLSALEDSGYTPYAVTTFDLETRPPGEYSFSSGPWATENLYDLATQVRCTVASPDRDPCVIIFHDFELVPFSHIQYLPMLGIG